MNEKEKELNEVLEELTKNLDITDTEDAAIRESYNAVGEFLAKEGTLLDKYEVEIFPQGSFNLGTIIRPVKEGDDLDIDLVCELKSKEPNWPQYDVKQQAGNHELLVRHKRHPAGLFPIPQGGVHYLDLRLITIHKKLWSSVKIRVICVP